jgi:hypothetical protein
VINFEQNLIKPHFVPNHLLCQLGAKKKQKTEQRKKEKGQKRKEKAPIGKNQGVCVDRHMYDTYRHEGDCVTHMHELSSNASTSAVEALQRRLGGTQTQI